MVCFLISVLIHRCVQLCQFCKLYPYDLCASLNGCSGGGRVGELGEKERALFLWPKYSGICPYLAISTVTKSPSLLTRTGAETSHASSCYSYLPTMSSTTAPQGAFTNMNQIPSLLGQKLFWWLLLRLISPILPRASKLGVTRPCHLSAGDHAFWCVPGTLAFLGQACDYLRAFAFAVPFAWTSLSLDFPINVPLGLLWPSALKGTLLFSLGHWWLPSEHPYIPVCFLLVFSPAQHWWQDVSVLFTVVSLACDSTWYTQCLTPWAEGKELVLPPTASLQVCYNSLSPVLYSWCECFMLVIY